jgi:UDP-N-acetylmuramoylalanine--D-glutamate ligase
MQKESEYCLLNYDDKIVREFASEVKCKIKWVSIKEKVDGAYLHNGKLYFMDECVMDEKQLKLKGEHNVYDALFAIASTKILGVENQKIESALTNFKGIKHRLEFVGTKNGVDFYNDSKATNTASTISAINFMDKPTVLILGGSEKGEDYTSLFEKIKMSLVKHVVLTGASRYNMLEQASKVGLSEISITSKFDFAVKIASMMSNSGENVLLSPACASFDAFNSYAERGDEFVKIVGEL